MGLFDTTDDWQRCYATWEGIQDAPAPQNRKHLRGFRVLKNDFLENFLGKSHWIMPGVWFVPVIAICLWGAFQRGLGGWQILGLVLLGVLGWTLLEYVLHRFVFHFPPTRIPAIRYTMFVMHGYHHECPNDPGRLVAPPILSWPLGILIGLLYWAFFGPYWQALFAGTVIGYLAYDWTHYYQHHAVPKTRFGKFMRRYHLEHHFKSATTRYGISTPLWDMAFLTFRKPGAPNKVETDCLRDESAARAH